MSVIKFVNGSNDSLKYLEDINGYITDSAKTDDGKFVGGHCCSHKAPLESMITVKRLNHKTHGKQGEHFVLSLTPDVPTNPDELYMTIADKITGIYKDYQCIYALHKDTRVRHLHFSLNSVNFKSGKKFSQCPSELNRIKQRVNKVLKEHGFDIINISANEFLDTNDYSDSDDFNFLEIDETTEIEESDESEEYVAVSQIAQNNYIGDYIYRAPIRVNNIMNDYNYERGYCFMNNNYADNTNNAVCTQPTETEINPVPQSEVSCTPTVVQNNLPNVSVQTGPIIRIKGSSFSEFNGLGELIEKTTEYAASQQIQSANVAYAMGKKFFDEGYNTNVSVIAGPTFDINLNGTPPAFPTNIINTSWEDNDEDEDEDDDDDYYY